MNVNVSPTEKFPSHHISLSDGTTTIGLIAVNPNGQADITAIRREPFPRTTLRGQEGGGLLSENQPPYGEFTRDTFIGGDGQQMADMDRTRYYDGMYLWTPVDKKIYPAPRIDKAYIPGDIDFPTTSCGDYKLTFGGSVIYAATKIVTPASGNLYVQGLYINTLTQIDPVYSPDIKIFIANNNSTYNIPDINNIVPNSLNYLGDWGFRHFIILPASPCITLSPNTTYWIVQQLNNSYSSGCAPVALLREAIENGPTPVGMTSQDGVNWTTIPNSRAPSVELLYYNSSSPFGGMISKAIPFEYKHALYVVEKVNGVTKLYMNGDRGVTTANTDATKVIDTTKSWTTNIWNGAVVKIIESPAGSEQMIGQWRRIVSNTSTALTVSPAFESAIGAGFSYVIIHTLHWQEITGHGLSNVTSVAATNEDVLYFAQGTANNIRRTRWRNNGTAWVNDGWVDETTKANILLFAWDQEKKSVLWRAVNGSKPYIARCTVPVWGTALSWETEIYIGGDDPIRAITEFEGKIAVRKSTEMWMVKSGVPDKLSLNMSTRYSDENGTNNMCVFTPYLVFPYSGKVQFLVNNIAENKGPWSPVTGEPIAMQPIVGGLLVAYSRQPYSPNHAGENSTVYLYKDDAWHPIVTMPQGLKILSIYYQHIDGGTDVLWIFTINGIYYINFPRELDYLRDSYYNDYCSDMRGLISSVEPFGMIDTGAFNLGNMRLNKWWERIYISAAKVTGFTIAVVYSGNPFDSHLYWYSASPMDADGICNIRTQSKGIQFQIYWYGILNNRASKPYINGYNVEYLARVDDADMWVVPLDISDYSRDLNGKPEEMTAAQKQQQLDTWARSVVPLTMRSIDPVDDNKRVIIERSPRQIRRYNQMVDEPDHRMGVYTSIVIKEVPD